MGESRENATRATLAESENARTRMSCIRGVIFAVPAAVCVVVVVVDLNYFCLPCLAHTHTHTHTLSLSLSLSLSRTHTHTSIATFG